MVTDPNITTSAELQNPILNREDVLKRKPINPESEIPSKVDLNNYSKETLNDKSKLEKNPACIIHQETESNNTLVRNEIKRVDKDGNETRSYVYNVVNKDEVFAAEVTGFVPGEYDADQVDKEIALFLKKGINSKEQIEDIKDARIAVLAGIISRKDYKEVENRLSQKKAPEIVNPPSQVTESPTQNNENPKIETTNSGGVTSIRNEMSDPNPKVEILLKNLETKYFSEETDKYIKIFNMTIVGEMGSSLNKLRGSLEEIARLDSRNIEQNMFDFLRVYQENITPKLDEIETYLSKYSLNEVNNDIRSIDTEINSLSSQLAGVVEENLKEMLRQKIKKLENFKQRMKDFRIKTASICNELNQIAFSARNNLFEGLPQQALGFRPVNEKREDFMNKIESILKKTQ